MGFSSVLLTTSVDIILCMIMLSEIWCFMVSEIWLSSGLEIISDFMLELTSLSFEFINVYDWVSSEYLFNW